MSCNVMAWVGYACMTLAYLFIKGHTRCHGHGNFTHDFTVRWKRQHGAGNLSISFKINHLKKSDCLCVFTHRPQLDYDRTVRLPELP